MGLTTPIARAVASASRVMLKSLFHRPAANFPGKMALYIDPQIIAACAGRLSEGSICVVGTNGKTTVTNMIADALVCAGKRVACNREGANLDSGVASVLLHTRAADWGVFECDELWLSKILPQTRSKYVVLLNLFRDQLDRVGEIDRTQKAIASALASSPESVLVYNADDPLCQAIALRVPNPTLPFGVNESMHLVQNTIADARMCQNCSGMLTYEYRQYGQLGRYRCPTCGFARPEVAFAAHDVHLDATGLSVRVNWEDGESALQESVAQGSAVRESALRESALQDTAVRRSFSPSAYEIHGPYNASYMVYNLLAVTVASMLLGVSNADLQNAIDAFDPQNGRLQWMNIHGRRTLLNLAKNPTGFNQNLAIANTADTKVVAFFINDNEADGHDISWIWDVDFEELASKQNLAVFAGGTRKHDVVARLKYAGVAALPIDDAREVFDALESAEKRQRLRDSFGLNTPHVVQHHASELDYLYADENLGADVPVFMIANYTSLPGVRSSLMALAQEAPSAGADSSFQQAETSSVRAGMHSEVADAQDVHAESQQVGRETQTEGAQLSRAIPTDGAASESADAAADVSHLLPGEQPFDAQLLEGRPLTILHMFPDLLNLYGDGGNVRVLAKRCMWRGIPVEVAQVQYGDQIDISSADVLFLGGGPDREQALASAELLRYKDAIRAHVEADRPLLAICGGYQILGPTWLMGDGEVEGLDILPIQTRRARPGAPRIIDNVALKVAGVAHPVIGYENHAGRTYLEGDLASFGQVINSAGHGNNDDDKADGARYKNLLATYLHGPLLSKNPEVADMIILEALRARGLDITTLPALDDTAELRANETMARRLGVQ